MRLFITSIVLGITLFISSTANAQLDISPSSPCVDQNVSFFVPSADSLDVIEWFFDGVKVEDDRRLERTFTQESFVKIIVFNVTKTDTVFNDSLLISNCASGNPNFLEIRGRVFTDFNGNGIEESNDVPLQGAVIVAQPGGYSAVSNVDGNYTIKVPFNQFSIQALTTELYAQSMPISPSSYDGIDSEVDNNSYVFGLWPLADIGDLVISANTRAPKLNGQTVYDVKVENKGTQIVNAVEVDFTHDQNMVFDTSSIEPSEIFENNYKYRIVSLDVGESVQFSITMSAFESLEEGQIVTHRFDAKPDNNDYTPANNTIILKQRAVDNDDLGQFKSVFPAPNALDELSPTSQLVYNLNYVNEGLSAVNNVIITDSLPVELRGETVQTLLSNPPVDVRLDGQKITWEAYGLNIPPGEGGYVQFMVNVVDSLVQEGTQIDNVAHFQLNSVTALSEVNTVLFTNDITSVQHLTATIETEVFPNPFNTNLQFKFTEADDYTLSLFDISGKEMLRKDFNGNATEISTLGLQSGIYLYQITNQQGAKTFGRVMKR